MFAIENATTQICQNMKSFVFLLICLWIANEVYTLQMGQRLA